MWKPDVQPLLQLTAVTRCFPAGEREAVVLKPIDLSIAAGEIVAITGASGSGKSTLMNILGCLDRPSSGSYRIAGIETSDLDADALARLRREHFGFIFQRYHLIPYLSATENVEVPAVYAARDPVVRQARAAQLLARLGLAERAAYRPNQLSGGQQQRVSIARALMNGGNVILADEPTGALDSKSGQDVMRILHELHASGHTVLIVTHDEQIAAHAHRIIEIHDGEIVSDRSNVPLRHGAQQDETLPIDAMAGGRSAAGSTRDTRSLRCNWRAAPRHLQEVFRLTWHALLSHRLRTVLTMLGMVIGIMSVVSVIAIGEGAKRYMLEEITSMGTNTINIYPGRDWGDTEAGAIETLVPEDAFAIAEQQYVDSATPQTSRVLLLRYRNLDVNGLVNGVGEQYFQVHGITLAQGIGFSADDVRRHAQVAVIDQNTRRRLFGARTDPLGQIVFVANVPCVVIGVTADQKNLPVDTNGLNLWIPFSTASGQLLGQRRLDSITVRIRDGQPSDTAENQIVALLKLRHNRQDFFTYNVNSVAKTAERASRSFTLLLTLIGAISLISGGVGVMNIMLVSVSERTREIGIRIAVGARRSDVMQQFLAEAVAVCLIGGTLGIALSYGMRFVFPLFVTQWNMVFTAGTLLLAFLCATLTGLLFGYMPARNAARLSPIEALIRD